jgi:hypothetical protein
MPRQGGVDLWVAVVIVNERRWGLAWIRARPVGPPPAGPRGGVDVDIDRLGSVFCLRQRLGDDEAMGSPT